MATAFFIVASGGGSGPPLSDNDPLPDAPVADPGVGTEASRWDHVHPEAAAQAAQRVQAWNGFDPGVQPAAVGSSYLEAAVANQFNLEGGTTDIFAGVLFKLGPRATKSFDTPPGFQFLWSNADIGAAPPIPGWILGISADGPGDFVLVAGTDLGTGAFIAWPIGLPINPGLSPTGPTTAPASDRLIFGVLHIRNAVPGTTDVELYINGGRIIYTPSLVGDYLASAIKPTVGYTPTISPIDPNGQSFAEIAGVCFSHMAIPAGPTYTSTVAALMEEAWRTTRAACAIASLTADNRLDWDHRWNASAIPTPPIIGPNGYPYVVSDPAVVGPIADEGNTGGFAAPSAGPPVALGEVGTALTVVTTEWPDWFSWQLPWEHTG